MHYVSNPCGEVSMFGLGTRDLRRYDDMMSMNAFHPAHVFKNGGIGYCTQKL